MALEDGSPREGIRLLRRHHEGDFEFDERVGPVRFVIDGRTGHLVIPIEPAALEAVQHVLTVPKQSDPVFEILVAPERVDSDWDEGCDRWRAYHADAHRQTFVRCRIESAKCDGWIFDGDALMHANEIRAAEPRLVKMLNADRDRLRRLCLSHTGTDVAEPMVVGVDPDGIDVRARFGIVRIEFSDQIAPEEIEDHVRSLLETPET